MEKLKRHPISRTRIYRLLLFEPEITSFDGGILVAVYKKADGLVDRLVDGLVQSQKKL